MASRSDGSTVEKPYFKRKKHSRREILKMSLAAAVAAFAAGRSPPAHPSVVVVASSVNEGSGTGVYSYPGIPAIDADVPNTVTQLTGDLPSGPAVGNSWGYDPLQLEAPTPTPGGASDEWYVDLYNGNNGTAGQGGQGTDAAPRLTMPPFGTTFSPGDKVFVAGQGTAYPTSSSTNRESPPDTSWTNRNIVGMQGTAANPIWIVGIDNPRLPPEIEFVGASNVIIDGIIVENITGQRNSLFVCRGDSDRFCFRNGGIFGAYTDAGGTCFSISDSDFVCLYNSEIAYHGIWDDHVNDRVDRHATLPGPGSRQVWIIDNELHECSGDGMQVTGSLGGTDSTTERAQYIYFAGNECYGFRENVVDCKNCIHVFVSTNIGYDNPGSPTGPGYTFYVNNAEGDETKIVSLYQWFINNIAYDAAVGYGCGADHEGGKAYFLGNVAYDCDTAFWPCNYGGSIGSRSVEQVWANNTAVRCGIGIDYAGAYYSGNTLPNAYVRFRGNLTYEITGSHAAYDSGGDMTTELSYHVAYDPGGSATIDTVGWDTATGNVVDDDPELADPDNNIFTLGATSSALGIIPTIDSAYDLFETLYGLNIKKDIAGTTIPDTNLDAGAYQRAA